MARKARQQVEATNAPKRGAASAPSSPVDTPSTDLLRPLVELMAEYLAERTFRTMLENEQGTSLPDD